MVRIGHKREVAQLGNGVEATGYRGTLRRQCAHQHHGRLEVEQPYHREGTDQGNPLATRSRGVLDHGLEMHGRRRKLVGVRSTCLAKCRDEDE